MQYFRSTFSLILFGWFAVATAQQPSDYFEEETGLPGDHLNLSAVLQLFKEAESIESFETALNQENRKVNNLDLNEDGQVDYIRLYDVAQEDAHALVLQVPISENESQDIAVIEIEKTGDGSAVLQIVGDEDIYGEQWIVEPFIEEDHGRGPAYDARVRLVVNVWAWPSVRFMYRPNYVAWVSPWRYRHYPRWWRPWKPFTWGGYFAHHRHHHLHFHVAPLHRVHRAHGVYVPRRTVSISVQQRHRSKVVSYRARPNVAARASFTKTTSIQKTGPRGGTVTASKTTKVGIAKGSNGEKAVAKGTAKSIRAEGPKGNVVKGQKKQTQAVGQNGAHRRGAKRTQVKRQHEGPQGARASSKRTSAKTFKTDGTQRVTSKTSRKSNKAKSKNRSGATRKVSAKKVRKRK